MRRVLKQFRPRGVAMAHSAIVVTLEFNGGGAKRGPRGPMLEPSTEKHEKASRGRRARCEVFTWMLVKIPGHCYRPDNDRLDLSVDFLIYRHATWRGEADRRIPPSAITISPSPFSPFHTLKSINYYSITYLTGENAPFLNRPFLQKSEKNYIFLARKILSYSTRGPFINLPLPLSIIYSTKRRANRGRLSLGNLTFFQSLSSYLPLEMKLRP